MSVPFHAATVHKQGDGSHTVRVIHSISGESTDVSFPYTAHSQALADEYAAFKNSQKVEAVAKSNAFGLAVATPPAPAPTVVNTPPVVVAPVVEVPAPVVAQPEPEVIKVPVPAGDENIEVKALEEQTEEAAEEAAEEPAAAQE